MKYLMFVVLDPDHTEADAAAAPPVEEWFAATKAAGVYQGAIRLHGTDRATTVRVRGGKVLVTDGPFAETKEAIAGVAILECASLEQAIEVASRNHMAFEGRLELRPIHSMGGPDD
jgi:hypothetical protein